MINQEANIKDPRSSKEMRAKRLKIIRQMTGLNRQAFASKYGISFSNFQNWEGPRYGGLTEQGAIKTLQGCKAEGVEASLEWLMHGVEPGPQITEMLYQKSDFQSETIPSSIPENSELEIINRELLLFKQDYQYQILEMIIIDDGMAPCYNIGEYVAGKYFYGEDIAKIINHDCIIELLDKSLVLRHLKLGSTNGLYTLICNNPRSTVNKPVIYDTAIIKAAPITWIRRKTYNNP